MGRHSSPLFQASLSSLTVAESRSALSWENKQVGACICCEALLVTDELCSFGASCKQSLTEKPFVK